MIISFSVPTGYLGLVTQDLGLGLARALRLPNDSGALVVRVLPDGPADRAGVIRGDVITAVNGEPIPDRPALRRLVAQARPGSEAVLALNREGRQFALTAVVTRRPFGIARKPRPESGADAPPGSTLGLVLKNLTPDLARELDLNGHCGVVVIRTLQGSPAASAGLRPGDLLRELNRNPVETVEEFARLAAGLGDDETALLFVQRGNDSFFTVFQVPSESRQAAGRS